MHEIPKDLSQDLNRLSSLKSSAYGPSRSTSPQNEFVDLEKGPEEDYGDKQFDRALNQTESSLILHPTRSTRGMNQLVQHRPNNQDYDLEKQDHGQSSHTSNTSGDDYHHDDALRLVTDHKDGGSEQDYKTPQTPAKKSVIQAPPVKDLDPAANRLAEDDTPLSAEDFYGLVGMWPPTSKNEMPKQLAKPRGLYHKIWSYERFTHQKYRIFDLAAYSFLMLQIIISAVFIVLGSLPHLDSHIAIAVLGAVSTVIGGALMLMKGQGLPNRLRMARDAMRNVIFEAEELYWDARSGRTVLYRDVKKVREDYLRVLEQQRKNHPDTWISSADEAPPGTGKESKKEKAAKS